MNKKLVPLQALIMAGLILATPVSFAGTTAQPAKVLSVTATPVRNAESSFSISGKITSIDESAITLMTSDKVYYSLELSQFKKPSDLKALKVKTGLGIKVNCKLESINVVMTSEDAVNVKPVELTESKNTTVAKAIPADKIQETIRLDTAQLTAGFSVVSDSKQPFELPFAVSVEIGGKVLQLK